MPIPFYDTECSYKPSLSFYRLWWNRRPCLFIDYCSPGLVWEVAMLVILDTHAFLW